MKLILDDQYQLIYQWNKGSWQCALSDITNENQKLVYCYDAPTQLDLFDIAIQVAKSWREHYGNQD